MTSACGCQPWMLGALLGAVGWLVAWHQWRNRLYLTEREMVDLAVRRAAARGKAGLSNSGKAMRK